jgi:flavin-dependent dehydrogenase
MSQADSKDCDVLIIGGGPAGSMTGLLLARAGIRTLLLEKTTHPRFHIGESLLPRTFDLLKEAGLLPALRQLPHVPKFGAEFGMGDASKVTCYKFSDAFVANDETFNIERAAFDKMLLDEARKAGTEVREETTVKNILRLADGDVAIETESGETLTAKYLIDASGQHAVLGRHLGTRTPAKEPHLQKVAYFSHFEGVKRLEGREEGYPLIIMCDEGWFWLIHIDAQRTSIGAVLDKAVAKQAGIPADRMLAWAMSRCPLIQERCANATGPVTNNIIANFSYRCRPYAGPGYFLVGDAAAFMDPIFSTGVSLGTSQARELAIHVREMLDGRATPAAARKRYIAFTESCTKIFFKFIRKYYQHSFRELFLEGTGPLNMHRAVLTMLAANVFPRPAWKLRWRLSAFYLCVWLNRFLPLVPRQNRFSLLSPTRRNQGRSNEISTEPIFQPK